MHEVQPPSVAKIHKPCCDSISVLLVSPRLAPGDSRYCGDHAYTDLLLNYPPPGVQYVHYEDLMAAGKARQIRERQLLTYNLRRVGLLPPDMWFESVVTAFRPDLVHIYGFSAVVRLLGQSGPVPVILGTSTGSYSDLKYYHQWGERRIRRARRIKRWYLKAVNAYDSSLSPESAAQVLTWSEFSRRMHLEEGYVPPDRVTTLPPGFPDLYAHSPHHVADGNVRFLFIGRDFERKNGPMVVEAFRRVRAIYPDARLTVIGQPADGRLLEEEGVDHRFYVPRAELISEVYPSADVLLLPSRAEGYGLVIVEAMSAGLPSIAVDAWAMPEIIVHGQTGYLIRPDSIDDLVEFMTAFAASPGLTSQMRDACLERFRSHYSVEAHNARLARIYAKAMDRGFA